MNFNDWLDELADTTPDMKDFVVKLERFFDSGRFRANDFEAALETGMSAASETSQETDGVDSNA